MSYILRLNLVFAKVGIAAGFAKDVPRPFSLYQNQQTAGIPSTLSWGFPSHILKSWAALISACPRVQRRFQAWSPRRDSFPGGPYFPGPCVTGIRSPGIGSCPGASTRAFETGAFFPHDPKRPSAANDKIPACTSRNFFFAAPSLPVPPVEKKSKIKTCHEAKRGLQNSIQRLLSYFSFQSPRIHFHGGKFFITY